MQDSEYNSTLRDIRNELDDIMREFEYVRNRLNSLERDGHIRALSDAEIALMQHVDQHRVFEVRVWILKRDDEGVPRLDDTEPTMMLAWEHVDYFRIGNPDGLRWDTYKLSSNGEKVNVHTVRNEEATLAHRNMGGNLEGMLQVVAINNFTHCNPDIANSAKYIWRVVSVLPLKD